MKRINIIHNPFLLFFPFLFLYIIIAFVFPTNGTFGDEGRYLGYAENLLNGHYSNSYPDINLRNGPGYPIILMSFIGFKLPLIGITILNALFYYLSIIFLFKSIDQLVNSRWAVAASLFWAFYINNFEYIPIIYSEIFTTFLISVLCFTLIKSFSINYHKKSIRYIILSGIIFGMIVLTKIIFGYVLLILLTGSFVLWIFNRKSSNHMKGLIILLISFMVNIPYLFYTYSLTGNLFYWGSTGGDNLYWMSSPFRGEYGDWQSFDSFISSDDITSREDSLLNVNHYYDYKKLTLHNGVINDKILTHLAINNIKSHPVKFLENWGSNVGRILFNLPYSYTLEKPGTLLRLPFNGIICILLIISMFPTYINWRKINYAIRLLVILSIIYLGGSSLASAETRMFSVVVPILLIHISYILNRTIKLNFKFKNEPE